MKLKQEFILREIAGDYILVPNGETIKDFNGLITMNEVGAFIWSKIPIAESREVLLSYIIDEYDVEEDIAKHDLDEFLKTLEKAEIL